MQRRADILHLSPTDLAAHLGCRHLSQLDRAVAHGLLAAPHRDDPALDALITRGELHERAWVARRRAEGLSVRDFGEENFRDPAATLAAMRQGIDLLVQAPVAAGRWTGRADVLRRVPAPSDLGAFSYEPVDTKLARRTRAGTLLQLCVYADILRVLQGRTPDRFHVVTPLAEEVYRTASYLAYFRYVRARLERAVTGSEPPVTYPDPVPQCDVCRWWPACSERRRTDDHLCLVAGIQSVHVRELERQGVDTLGRLAALPGALPEKPDRGSVAVYARLCEQAELQQTARGREVPPHRLLLPPAAGRGLCRLPQASPGDVFLDFEGDPFVDGGGLEYLTGWVWREPGGNREYAGRWALDRNHEKQAFAALLDFVLERWSRHPDLHVYHYGHYEPSALKRLVNRHGTHADALDRLLRGQRFVDLHAVVREGLRAGVERYGLKQLEALTGFARCQDLREAALARQAVELALEVGDPDAVVPEVRLRVTDYNREDCESAAALRDWLEELRRVLVANGTEVPRPPPAPDAPSEAVTERERRIREVVEPLLEGLPPEALARDAEQNGTWLLAQMLGYFNREEKCAWWEHYRLRDLDLEELFEERDALAGLEFEHALPREPKDRTVRHRYRFPAQETALAAGKAVRGLVRGDAEDKRFGTVLRIDLNACTLDLKKTKDTASAHPAALFANQVVSAGELEDSLLALGGHAREHGLEGGRAFGAACDLLRRRPPRRAGGSGGPLRRAGEDLRAAAVRLCGELDGGVLPVQGPPGSGKTWLGARAIVALVAAGKRVGVTAVSHKVIVNLLQAVRQATGESGRDIRLVHRTDEDEPLPGIESADSNETALGALAAGAVVGGTAWLWARAEATGTLDHLFVDEAGQMALAQVLAASRSAQNLVLLGDPQQLEQPHRGAHPEGAEVASLVHVSGPGHATLADEQGLFLDVTWRMHPALCAFTSEVYYEGRLSALPGLERQELRGTAPFAGSGLFLVETPHAGRRATAPEEVDAVAGIARALLQDGSTWVDREGVEHALRPEDILVVAPYNAQVAALKSGLRATGVTRVGTVDRFQGQEAPVVVYSCTSSSPEDAPRGMAFLYDPHRFNVATSRARCAVIVVASPRLFEPECRTPEQMRMANGFCRFRELARVIDVSDPGRPR